MANRYPTDITVARFAFRERPTVQNFKVRRIESFDYVQQLTWCLRIDLHRKLNYAVYLEAEHVIYSRLQADTTVLRIKHRRF